MKGRVDCIRSATTEALEWAKAMCQGEGANLGLDTDPESDGKKVKFNIYSVSRSLRKDTSYFRTLYVLIPYIVTTNKAL